MSSSKKVLFLLIILKIQRDRARKKPVNTGFAHNAHYANFVCGAQGETRTRTLLRAEDFESSVSTISPPRHPMVPARGVEPPTFALRMRCSTN